jgi:hypothetical protein
VLFFTLDPGWNNPDWGCGLYIPYLKLCILESILEMPLHIAGIVAKWHDVISVSDPDSLNPDPDRAF